MGHVLRQKGWSEEMCFVAADSERHVYRPSWWARTGYLLLGILIGGSGLTLVATTVLSPRSPGDLRSFGAMILCPLVGYGFLSLALRSRVILGGDRLTVRYVFGQDSAQIAKIVPLRDKGEPSC